MNLPYGVIYVPAFVGVLFMFSGEFAIGFGLLFLSVLLHVFTVSSMVKNMV